MKPLSSAVLYRLSSASLILGCVLLVVGDLIRIAAGTAPTDPLLASGWFIQAIGAMLAALGLPATCLRQTSRPSVMSLVGVVGISLFLFVFLFGGLVHALVVPELAKRAPDLAVRPKGVGLAFLAGSLFLLIGSLSLGVATIRAGVLSRWVGILLIVGGIGVGVGHPLGKHVEDVGLVVLVAALGLAGLSLTSITQPFVRVSAQRPDNA